MRSLWLKLLAAFVVVILLGAVIDAIFVSRATRGQFTRFVTASGQGWAEQVAPVLASFYARTGEWQGVDGLLRSPWPDMVRMAQADTGTEALATPGRGSGMRGMMGSDMGGMMDHDGMMHMMGGDMWAMMGLRLILADAGGQVVADTGSALIGESLTAAEQTAGTPIMVEGEVAGVLLPVTAVMADSSPAYEFLSAANRAIWFSTALSAALALLLGSLLFRQIVAPVRGLTAAAQQIADGHLEQRVPVTSQDEIGQLAVAFNDMADALTRDEQLRRNMMADITHELRTPLSVIQGNLEAMLDGVLPAEPQEIALLHDETLLLTRLVADLHLLALAEAGQLHLEKAPADLGEIVERAVDPLRVQAEANHVTLATELAPNLPTVAVDAVRIEQVLGNLLHNALRYTPAQGRITVRAFPEPAAGEPRSVVVEVEDTGKGIAAGDLPHVFERFYRADKSRSRASGGSGIGLALVKQLVEAHDGSVRVESEVGAGTTFAITLPVAPAAPARPS